MALGDIDFIEGSTSGFILEFEPQTYVGSLTDITEDCCLMTELTLAPGGGGEVSHVF